MLKSWEIGKFGGWNIGMQECWKIEKLESREVRKLESWKVRPNKVGKESEAQNIGQKLESQHRRLNISNSTNTSTHGEY